MSDSRCTRRAALVALFAVSVHFAASGRAHAETPAAVEAQDFVDDGEDLEFYEWAAGEAES